LALYPPLDLAYADLRQPSLNRVRKEEIIECSPELVLFREREKKLVGDDPAVLDPPVLREDLPLLRNQLFEVIEGKPAELCLDSILARPTRDEDVSPLLRHVSRDAPLLPSRRVHHICDREWLAIRGPCVEKALSTRWYFGSVGAVIPSPPSQQSLVGLRYESLQRRYVDKLAVGDELLKPAGNIELAKFPSFAAQD
jgi:hypothetical protein